TRLQGDWSSDVCSSDLKDYLAAAQAFQQGSNAPNAHPFLKILAARMAERGGDVETARLLWTTTYETSRDLQIKANALSHLRALRSEERRVGKECSSRTR